MFYSTERTDIFTRMGMGGIGIVSEFLVIVLLITTTTLVSTGGGVVADGEVAGDKTNFTQRFTLHADEGCQDEGETYTENVRNLGRISPIVRTKALRCACADFGVCVLYFVPT